MTNERREGTIMLWLVVLWAIFYVGWSLWKEDVEDLDKWEDDQ